MPPLWTLSCPAWTGSRPLRHSTEVRPASRSWRFLDSCFAIPVPPCLTFSVPPRHWVRPAAYRSRFGRGRCSRRWRAACQQREAGSKRRRPLSAAPSPRANCPCLSSNGVAFPLHGHYPPTAAPLLFAFPPPPPPFLPPLPPPHLPP